MCDQDYFEEDRKEYEARGLITRRQFGVLVAAGVSLVLPESANAQQTSEKEVEIKTPEGTCDAYFVYPATGSAAAVLIWPDIFGLRPAMKTTVPGMPMKFRFTIASSGVGCGTTGGILSTAILAIAISS